MNTVLEYYKQNLMNHSYGRSEDQTSTRNVGSKIVHEVKIVIRTLSGIELETICVTSGKKQKQKQKTRKKTGYISPMSLILCELNLKVMNSFISSRA